MKPNPNLWIVTWTSNIEPLGVRGLALQICAPNAGSAERKARAYLKRLGHRSVKVEKIQHEGTIDVF